MSGWPHTLLSHRLRGFDVHDASLAGLRAALAAEVTDIEVDVRRSADGALFIHHDPFVTSPGGRILPCHEAAMDELEAFAGRGFPRIEGFLDAFAEWRRGARLHIDLKISGAEEATLSALKARGLEGAVAFVSWVPSVLLAFRKAGCEAPLCLSYLPFDRYGAVAAAAARAIAPPLRGFARLFSAQLAREAAQLQVIPSDKASTYQVRDGANPALIVAGPPPPPIRDAVLGSDGYFCVPRRLAYGLDWAPAGAIAAFPYLSAEEIEEDKGRVSVFYCDFNFANAKGPAS